MIAPQDEIWARDNLVRALTWRLEKQQAGSAYDESDAPPIISGLVRLWNIFMQLNDTRGSNGYGMNPISFQEIEAMIRLTGNPLRSWEVEIIRAMDAAFLAIANRQNDDRPPKRAKAQSPKEVLAIMRSFKKGGQSDTSGAIKNTKDNIGEMKAALMAMGK